MKINFITIYYQSKNKKSLILTFLYLKSIVFSVLLCYIAAKAIYDYHSIFLN
ncbi:hypothetical protein BCD_1784 (plasmid) [Borrelia crocidurae DOU]|uniref:Uncharacterized protein n=1 Tax=Borrelia crocidurae DOU TaxID=1293575 RepID=W5SLX2_9SPIR|nr:hypothetical protein BCD_1784 [Borrelia crocidurae DOU]